MTRASDVTLYGPWTGTYNIGGDSSPASGSGYFQRRASYRDDIRRTPGFRKGEWHSPLPYWWEFLSTNVTTGSFRMIRRDDHLYYDEFSGSIDPWLPVTSVIEPGLNDWTSLLLSDPEKAELRDLAITKCLTKLKNQKVNLAQAFAERQQTIDLAAGALKTIVGTLEDLHQRNYAGALRRLTLPVTRKQVRILHKKRGLQQKFLALEYGWSPLLSDVFGSCQALAEADRSVPQRYFVTVGYHGERRRGSNGSLPCTTTANDLQLLKINWRYAVQSKFKMRLDYFCENPYALSTLSSLGITNPALIAWELTPWSFVIDWFLPIGNWLSCLDADLGMVFRGGTWTIDQQAWSKRFYTSSDIPLGHTGIDRVYGNVCSVAYRVGRRDVETSSPLPRRPHFKNPLSLLHIGEAIALAIGFKNRANREGYFSPEDVPII